MISMECVRGNNGLYYCTFLFIKHLASGSFVSIDLVNIEKYQEGFCDEKQQYTVMGIAF